MEYLRDAILGCCLNLLLCDKNANFYINMKNRPDITRAYGCRRYVGQKAAGSWQAEVLCAGIERENTGVAPGVVKNLEGDTDLAEGECYSISPDLIKV